MKFLRYVWKFLVGVKDALALLFLLIFFGFLVLLFAQFSGPAAPSDGAALRIGLDGALVDQATPGSPVALLTGQSLAPEIEVGSVLKAIHTAKSDKAISSIVLDLDAFAGGGPANLQAVGNALDDFRKSGKKVSAFATTYTDGSYYLAAHADDIALSPIGAVYIRGYGGSGLYYKQLLDRLKVDVEVFRVGKYKSFVEPFTRTSSSPEAKQADQQLADDLWHSYVTDIDSHRRGVSLDPLIAGWAEAVRASNGTQAELAQRTGLVDRIATRRQFTEGLRQALGDNRDEKASDNYNYIDFEDYLSLRTPLITRGDGVGVLHVSGTIVDGWSPVGEAGADTISGLIDQAANDSNVKALVVRIDSPGGSVTASEQIREALVALRSKGIPVVASFGPVAASGGYWISTAAEYVVAQPTTITGSIGVFGVLPTFERTLAAVGVTSDGVGTTPFSGQPDPVGGLNADTRIVLQRSVEDTYRRFLQLVSAARGLPADRTEALAEGRVWSGTRAKDLGLVDSFGDLDAAIAEAARRAKLGPNPRIIPVEGETSFLWGVAQRFLSSSAVAVTPRDPFAAARQTAQAQLSGQIGAALQISNGAGLQARCLPCAPYGVATGRTANTDALPVLQRLFAKIVGWQP